MSAFIGRREFMAAFGAAVSAPVVARAVLTGGGGVGLPPVTINSDWTTYNYQNGRGDLASPYMPIPFYAYCNPFNTGSLVRGTDYTTSVVVHPSTFPNNTVFNWSFPDITASSHVYEADLVVWGSYFNGNPQTTIPPCQVRNLTTLTVTIDYSLSGETNYFDLIFDFYLYPTSVATNTIAHEFSICLHDQYYVPALIAGLSPNFKFNYTDSQGAQWVIYSLAGGATGAQIVVERADFTNVPNNYTIDIKGIIDACVKHGWVSATEWFVGTGLGAEAAQGSGSWTLNSVSFNYNSTTYP